VQWNDDFGGTTRLRDNPQGRKSNNSNSRD
jgi:hypothetical protein